MDIEFHKKFKKSLNKKDIKIEKKFFKILKIFQEDQFHYSLNNNALTGKFKGIRSINITGDIRAHYHESKDKIVFLNIGSHSELYS
jgi:addiction module RelE/StbE family toxin